MSINKESYAYGASKSSIREIAAYGSARKALIGAQNVFDFSLGNPSVPAPDEVRESIEHALTLPAVSLHGYTPAAGLPQARKAVADSLNRRFHTSYTGSDLYLTCGAAASLTITFNAIIEPGQNQEVAVVAPYFPEYKVFIENAGGRCVEVMADPNTFQVDVPAMEAAINDHTVAVLVNSPNNPVGSVYSRQNLQDLANMLKRKSAELGHAIYLIALPRDCLRGRRGTLGSRPLRRHDRVLQLLQVALAAGRAHWLASGAACEPRPRRAGVRRCRRGPQDGLRVRARPVPARSY